jgi:hypothetical protein
LIVVLPLWRYHTAKLVGCCCCYCRVRCTGHTYNVRWDRAAVRRILMITKSSKFFVDPTFDCVGLPLSYGQSLHIIYRWKGEKLIFLTVYVVFLIYSIRGVILRRSYSYFYTSLYRNIPPQITRWTRH